METTTPKIEEVTPKYYGEEKLEDFPVWEDFLAMYIRKKIISELESELESLGLDHEEVKKFKRAAREAAASFIYTQNHSAYLGWYLAAQLAGVVFNESLTLYKGYTMNVGHVCPYDVAAFASHRPLEIHWEEDNLHNENGMAIRYADGWGWYALTGIMVPEKVVMAPKTQTLDEINHEPNVEMKRLRIQQYGWPDYLKDMNAQAIDMSVHKWMETLFRCTSGDDTLVVLVTYDPSTSRIYALEVDPNIETCRDAQSYLLGDRQTFANLGLDKADIPIYPIVRT